MAFRRILSTAVRCRSAVATAAAGNAREASTAVAAAPGVLAPDATPVRAPVLPYDRIAEAVNARLRRLEHPDPRFLRYANPVPSSATRGVLGYKPTSHLSGAQVLPRWFSSLASNGSQISETYKSGGEMKKSNAQKLSEEATPKVVAFSPLEAAIAKPRSSPLTSESSKVRRSEIATQITFYMIPALLLVSKNSLSTSLLVGAVFHQVYMFHKEILLDYVHHDITRKWALIYFKLLLLVMAKDTIMYFNLF